MKIHINSFSFQSTWEWTQYCPNNVGISRLDLVLTCRWEHAGFLLPNQSPCPPINHSVTHCAWHTYRGTTDGTNTHKHHHTVINLPLFLSLNAGKAEGATDNIMQGWKQQGQTDKDMYCKSIIRLCPAVTLTSSWAASELRDADLDLRTLDMLRGSSPNL